VSSSAVSAITRIGWWNAPTRFLPWRELIPVLPPTEESTCASKVVGTCTTSRPRRSSAAASPERSPTTPPPSATTTSLRSMRASSSRSQTVSSMRQLFELSPGGTRIEVARTPASASEDSAAFKWCRATVSSATIAAAAPGLSAAMRAPSSASSPRPITMS
jgi:hypothetical protein